MRKFVACMMMVAFVGVLAPQAMADLSGTVDAKFTGVYGRNIHVSGNGHANAHVRVGVCSFQKYGSTGDGDLIPSPTFQGFCVDLEDSISSGQRFNWNVEDPDELPDGTYGPVQAARAGRIAELWLNHFDSVSTRDEAAAFQLAVWEIIYEDGSTLAANYDVSAGYNGPNDGFEAHDASSNVISIANGWLQSLSDGPGAMLIGMTLPNTQDFVTRAVPAPAAGLLGLLGLGGLGWLKRRVS